MPTKSSGGGGYTTTPTKKKSTSTKAGTSVPRTPAIKPFTAFTATGTPYGGVPQTVVPKTGSTTPGGTSTGGYSAASIPTGGQTAGVPGLNSEGASQYTGFMKQFNPGATQDTIFNNPQTILAAMAQQSGMPTAGPMYNTLRDFYGADPQSLWFLTQGAQGGNGGQNALNANTYGNFLNSMYSNYMSPNGRNFDFDEILRNIAGLSDQSQMGVADQSPLWQLLSSGGAPEQANTMYGLLADAARVGLAPSMASAFMDALRRQSDQYLTQNMQSTGGNMVPFYDWMQNPMQGG